MLCPPSFCQFTGVETKPQRGTGTRPRPPGSASTCWVQLDEIQAQGCWPEGRVPFHYSCGEGCPLPTPMGEVLLTGRPCLPGRYKLVELLCYVVMGFFPALVVLSMVSHPHPLWASCLAGGGPEWYWRW